MADKFFYFSNLNKFSEIEHFITCKITPQNLVLPEAWQTMEQVHQTKIKIVNKLNTQPESGADALITKEQGIALAVRTADCVPVLIYDPIKKIVACVHAGWRGTVYRVVQETIDVMRSDPADLVVGLGPAICAKCFNVGQEIAKHFPAEVKEKINEQMWQVDLWQANNLQLLERGVQEKNIEILEICTNEAKDLFPSFRRGDKIERFWSVIKLK